MERNGSKFIFCPFLEGDILAKTTAREIRKEELTKIVRRMFVKHKFNKIRGKIIDWMVEPA